MSSIAPEGAVTGTRYLESLRDGREVWYRGKRVRDVTRHPALGEMARSIARIYDLQSAPKTADVMTFESEGRRFSCSYLLPRTRDDLLRRRRNSEIWVRESFGMMGRYSDFCASMLVGFYDVREELASLNPDLAANVTSYHSYARDQDLCLSHGLHDPTMDKSLRPEQDPDRCLRIVEERDGGLVVRGARFATLAPFSNEILVAPSYPLNEREADHAIWFAIPIAWEGLKVLCRESFAEGRNRFDHPVSVRFDEQDALVVFDGVLVPWERVFLAREPAAAERLFRRRVMAWASYTSLTQLLGRLDLMIGTVHLLAETSGMSERQDIQIEIGELIAHTEMVRSALRAAEVDCLPTPGGLVSPAPLAHVRCFLPIISERLVAILEHVGTSSLVFLPTAEDLETPDIRGYIDRYFRGRGVPADKRVQLSKLAWELTGDSYGGRQQLYERLHAGDPKAITAGLYRLYDKTSAVEMVRRLLGWADEPSD
ncbi:MAG TPA: 4-hydroxyphenylacetate 3-hydroxylase N-terminal domain-containing protein [Vicinamibacteria bacterium]|nr:4-hydroxyphenylacetate 3-hydroxylase N-terminal domain-containing protein [Vicinamibacteria bacterium]